MAQIFFLLILCQSIKWQYQIFFNNEVQRAVNVRSSTTTAAPWQLSANKTRLVLISFLTPEEWQQKRHQHCIVFWLLIKKSNLPLNSTENVCIDNLAVLKWMSKSTLYCLLYTYNSSVGEVRYYLTLNLYFFNAWFFHTWPNITVSVLFTNNVSNLFWA